MVLLGQYLMLLRRFIFFKDWFRLMFPISSKFNSPSREHAYHRMARVGMVMAIVYGH